MSAPAKEKAAETPLRLNELEITNFKSIRARRISPKGHHVKVSGPNESGKTSTCEAIWTLLRGYKSKECPAPIFIGENKAVIRADFGEFTVERVFTPKGNRLTVERADGSKVSDGQEMLKALIGPLSGNLSEFIDARPIDQVETVLSVVGVDPPAAQVQTITGEAHTPLPGESAYRFFERLCADETGVFYHRRREARRLLDQKKAALEEERQVLQKLGGPVKEEEAQATTGDTLKAIAALEAKDDQRKALVDRASEARKDADAAKEKLDGLQSQRGRETESITALDAQIAALQAKRAKHAEAVEVLDGRIAKGTGVVGEYATEASACQEAADKFPDPRSEIARLRAQVQQAEQQSAARIKRQMQQERVATLAVDVEKADAAHQREDGLLNRLRALRSSILDGIDLGIPGLKVGNGELLLKGVPFVQASKSQKSLTAAAVAVRQKPGIGILWFDDANHLDDKNLDQLLRFADEHNVQVFYGIVANQDGLKIEIIDAED
jgi:recombinational DNA repair ATPase RecF